MNHLDKKKITRIVITLFLFLILGFIILNFNTTTPRSKPSNFLCSDPEPFYVGVTYCGDSVAEAKQLIDKVKDYTNLFVIQSGTLQSEPEILNEICDYAVNSGLYFMVYFGNQHWNYRNNWLLTFKDAWSGKFLGVYFGDEPGGKMLDGNIGFFDEKTSSEIKRYEDGTVCRSIYLDNNTAIAYYSNATIVTILSGSFQQDTLTLGNSYYTYYYSNGTITAVIETPEYEIIPIENPSPMYTYDELLDLRPFQTYDEIAKMFVERCESYFGMGIRDYWILPSLTSDYALYWFDYLSGYDAVMAQVGWNNTFAQDIALVRGAANLQNKSWGIIVTWKYNHPPYLDTGEAIFEQMQNSYIAGAKYSLIFNYADDMTEPYGTLQEEHFTALESFWNEVVQNPDVTQGSIKAETVLVLPENYGWGMRDPNDKIWGFWGPDEKSSQIWESSQSLLKQYGLGLDIVYEDSEFPVDGKYSNIFYWNQTQ